jgi:hypothetical protein
LETNTSTSNKRRSLRRLYYWVFAAWLVYASLAIFNPHKGTAKYNLNPTETILLQLTVIIPLLLIWMVATYGAVRFRRYAEMIKSSRDGAASLEISKGISLLIVYLVSSTLVASIAPFAIGTDWLNIAVAAKNHLPIILGIAAFVLTYQGSVKLAALSKKSTWSSGRIIFFLVPFCLFAVFFTQLFYLNPNLHTVGENGLPAFALSNQLLLFTYVVPYLIIWFFGCLAALNIRLYAHHVKGSIYRKAFLNLALGVISVVLFTIILQVLGTSSVALGKLNLKAILLLVYLIIILDAVGYIFIAVGAKKLSKIEEAQ